MKQARGRGRETGGVGKTVPAPQRIPYGHHWIDEEDIAAVARALRAECVTQGPLIALFEARVAAYCGARYAVALSSGTAALHAACVAAGIGPGDEAITSPLTFVATANAVVYQGGTPVFADIDARTLNLDPQAMAQRITPRTKAVIPVHFAGLPCDLARMHAIAREHRLTIIEDAAHALGASWRTPEGREERIGSCSHSDMTVCSFHPVKQITTGEGGMVLTNSEALRDRLLLVRHHGLQKADASGGDEPWRSEMQSLGYNYRITDFQCALGLRQLEKLERFLARRREIADAYQRAFADLDCTLPPEREGTRHAWHLYVVQLPERLRAQRRAIFQALQAQGVGVNVHYLPVHLHPFYRERFGHRPGAYPAAEAYYERAITLPLFPRMSDDDVQHVITVVHKVLGAFRVSGAVAALAGASTSHRRGAGWIPNK